MKHRTVCRIDIKNPNLFVPLIAGVAVIVVGSILLFTKAAGFFAATEAENGTKSTNAQTVTDATASGGSAVKFTAQAGGGGTTNCPAPKRIVTAQDVANLKNSGYPAGTQLYMPGSPDPWGGCFPGEGNTGIPAGVALTSYSGSCNITTANTVISEKTISKCYTLSINANNVTIRNSKFIGSNLDVQSGSLTIEDSEADFGADKDGQGFTGSNITARRLNFYGGHRQAWCSNCLIEDSYFHDQNISQDRTAHSSAMRLESFSTYRHNTIWCNAPDYPEGGGCSADLTGYPDFGPIHDNTIDKNFLLATTSGGYCSYGGWNPGKPYNDHPLNATNIHFTNNVVQRGTQPNDIKDWQRPKTDKDRYTCAFWGPTTSYKSGRAGFIFTGNMWDDGLLWENNQDSLYYPFHE